MPLDTTHIETLIEAYTEAAVQAQRFADKYSKIYIEESRFYNERAEEFLAHATAAKALELDQSLQDFALYAAELKKHDQDDLSAAKKFFQVRKALWE
ncbi:MAG: hypothetical protein DKT66_28400 [Candidatus Melainabacteria bacterium]|jgi:hypothetical protein|nr:MAG: hypothetical protein DKT66_28400 [Candidatus Melainabacteria bacterium]